MERKRAQKSSRKTKKKQSEQVNVRNILFIQAGKRIGQGDEE